MLREGRKLININQTENNKFQSEKLVIPLKNQKNLRISGTNIYILIYVQLSYEGILIYLKFDIFSYTGWTSRTSR